MSKISELISLYKTKPEVKDDQMQIEGNSFTDMILQTKNSMSTAFDKLAYLAGIKAAPADDKYSSLNTNNLDDLLSSAKQAGYEVEIVGFEH